MLNAEERVLTALLNYACRGAAAGADERAEAAQAAETVRQAAGSKGLTREMWERVITLADGHNVLSLCYDVLKSLSGIPRQCQKLYEKKSRQVVYRNYRLLFLTRFVVKLLQEQKIRSLVLKGAVTALLYPVPELRKSGDVDLLLESSQAIETACRLLEEKGFQVTERQAALHHVALCSPEGITVELHGLLAEPFDNKRINQFLERLVPEMLDTAQTAEGWGIPLPAPDQGHHAYYLLIHMLQHFLRYGFGMKYLCDWVVFWNRDVEAVHKEKFRELASESGILGFARMVTAVCVEYLGLNEENVEFLEADKVTGQQRSELMKEVLEAGEFGKAQKDRMVVIREGGPIGYIREFHHQMRLNYPAAGKLFLLWPALWILTFWRFCRNNRRLRGISGTAILRKAAKRGRLVRKMDLFR